jgi:hypothetical protein
LPVKEVTRHAISLGAQASGSASVQGGKPAWMAVLPAKGKGQMADSVLRLFQPLLEFLYLWANHGLAIRLVRIRAVVILVIILALVELGEWHNLGDDGLAEMLLRLGF